MKLGGNSFKNAMTWQRIDNDEGVRPSPRHSFSMCYHYKTKQCLIFGGKNDQGQPFDDRVFSLMVDVTDHGITAKWKTIETSHTFGCVASHQCVCVGDSMFLFGGEDSDGKYINELYQMKIQTGEWIRVKTNGHQPQPRINHSMTSVGARIYIFGGINENGVLLNDLHVFDVNLSAWSAISTERSISSGVHGLSLLGMRNTNDDGDLLCLVLGANSDGPVSNIYTYSSKSNTWSSRPIKGDLQGGRSYFMSSLLIAGQIFLFGGYGISGPQNDSYMYNVLSGSWTKLHENDGIVPSPRLNMDGCKLGLDKVVVFGGLNDSRESLNDSWLARLHK